MRMPVVVIAAVFGAAAFSPAPSQAVIIGQRIAAPIDTMAPVEKVGCYRLGETGYHWYRFCFGPDWLYPHHRVCRRGSCWYR